MEKEKFNGLLNNVVNNEALKQITGQTLDDIANILSGTFGPYGGSTIIDKYPQPPQISKDGFTVLNALRYPGPIENAVLELVRKIATNQVISVGDGSTSAIISANEIFKRIRTLTNVINNSDSVGRIPSHKLANALENAKNKYVKTLMSLAKPVSDDMSEIKDIATIAINNDTELGNVVYEAFSKAGKDVEVTFEKELKQKEKAIVDYAKGIKIDYGFFTDRGHSSENSVKVQLKDTDVIVFNQKIEGNFMVDLFADIIQYYLLTGYNLTVIINGLGDRAKDFVSKTFYTQYIENINLIYMPQNTELNIQKAQDIALCCGGIVIDKDVVKDLKFYPPEFYAAKAKVMGNSVELSRLIISFKDKTSEDIKKYIGKAGEITSFKESTIIKDGLGLTTKRDIIDKEIAKEKEKLQIMKTDVAAYSDKMSLLANKRIATLSNTLVNIKIGGETEEECQATYDLVEDAVKASKSALKHGVVMGGNYAIIKAFYEMVKNKDIDLATLNIPDTAEKLEAVNKIVSDENKMIETLDTKLSNVILSEYVGVYNIMETAIIVAIAQAFFNMIKLIHMNGNFKNELTIGKICDGIAKDRVYNVVTEKYDDRILNSANTEIEILKSAMSIISILLNSNQMTISQPQEKVSHYGHYLTKINAM